MTVSRANAPAAAICGPSIGSKGDVCTGLGGSTEWKWIWVGTALALSARKNQNHELQTLQITTQTSFHHSCSRHCGGVDSSLYQIRFMSRKTERSLVINAKVLEIIEDPATLHYLGSKIIRRKPRLMPRFVWKGGEICRLIVRCIRRNIQGISTGRISPQIASPSSPFARTQI
jgi:hypothetical protein